MTKNAIDRRRILLAGMGAIIFPLTSGAAALPPIVVHKDPNCGCCGGWVEHLVRNGFAPSVRNTAGLEAIKARLKVPAELASCHTAEVSGYVVEGHVPASAISRLLAERPAARGLAVPGMPAGSPGMGGAPEAYEVILFGPSGQQVFARFKGEQAI